MCRSTGTPHSFTTGLDVAGLRRINGSAGYVLEKLTWRFRWCPHLIDGTYGVAHPLAPWTGFAVMCAYAVILIGFAAWRLRRVDA